MPTFMRPSKPVFGPRSPLWDKVRREHLKINPTCAACGTNVQLEVHHIKPFYRFPHLELDPSNLLTLCEGSRGCHYCFGHAYNWLGWVPTVRADAARHLRHVKESNDRS